MARPFGIDDMDLDRAIFEIRYDPAYLLWDRSGALWMEAQRKWPRLKHIDAMPNKTSFSLDRDYEFIVELEKAVLIKHYPGENKDRGLDKFAEAAKNFLELVVSTLEIDDFSRVGFRIHYFKKFKTRDEASGAMLDLGLLKVPEKSLFGMDGKALDPEYSLRWETKDKGVTVRIKAQNQKVGFEPPLNTPSMLKPEHHELFGVLVDLDYFTIGTLEKSALFTQDWILMTFRELRRGISTFLQG